MSIRSAILAISIGLWGCARNSAHLPTAPVQSGRRPSGKMQSRDITKANQPNRPLSKSAVFPAGSSSSSRNHGTNHPPIFNTSLQGTGLTLLLPRGPSASLRFPGQPATDPDGDEISYRFAFAVPGLTGIQTPAEALIRISRDGNNFQFRGDGDLSPGQFTAVYGNIANVPYFSAAIYAGDGASESGPEVFSLHLVYDGSAQFSAPAEYVADQRWEIPTPIEIYEGASMPARDDLPGWTAVTADYREWGFDWSRPRIRCEVVTDYFEYRLPDGGDDNALISLSSEERATSGTVSVAFKTQPDFEVPGDSDADNLYRLRVVNTNDIHYLNNEGTPTGCSGSVLDLTIRVKDVGTPVPPEVNDARFRDGDDSIVDVEWAIPGGFLENGSLVAFPAGFEVSDYDYRYRVVDAVDWTEVADTDLTETAVAVEGLTEDAYEFQVRATNSEGTGPWSSTVGAERTERTVSFGASKYTAVEGDPAGVEVAVYLDPAAGMRPITVPISVLEENGAGREDYSGVPSSLTFEPNEGMQTFTLTAMQDDDETESPEEMIRLNFGSLPSRVTRANPASAEVVLEDPPRIPAITGLRITSTPASGDTYGRGETISVEVSFDAPVVVTGEPSLMLKFYCSNIFRRARYADGSDTDALIFEYQVQRNDWDRNGMSVRPNQLRLNGGTMTALSGGMDANRNHAGLPDDPNHKVNGLL